MTPERWISLAYHEQKKALVEAVCREEEWDWADASTWEAFFESSSEADCVLRHFVDVQRLKMFFENKEIDDFDNDMGMDSKQYAVFSERLLTNLESNLLQGSESIELPLLESFGATFVIKEMYRILAEDLDGEILILRFTKNSYTDRRIEDFFSPFDEKEFHDSIDEIGEWMKIDVETAESINSDFYDLPGFSEEEMAESNKEMELKLQLTDGDTDEIIIPGYDEGDDSVLGGGLGDVLFDES
jgi:hypothetical protein